MADKHLGYNHTVYASFIGFIVQAINNNFLPLLFLTFASTFNIPLAQITLLITINFVVQFVVDLIAAFYVDKIGYRIAVLLAHLLSFIGLFSLSFLPYQLNNPFIGLVIPVVIYAIGGGLLEVLLSPIVEKTPTKHKESAMSLLHFFYCWGHVGMVLISSLYFFIVGVEYWEWLAIIWSLISLLNAFYFSQVPMNHVNDRSVKSNSFKELLSNKLEYRQENGHIILKKTKRKVQDLKHLDKETIILELSMRQIDKILILWNLSLIPHTRIDWGINNHS